MKKAWALTWVWCAGVLAEDSMEPVGPSGWTTRNWVGFAVYVGVFLLILVGLGYLANLAEKDLPASGDGSPDAGGKDKASAPASVADRSPDEEPPPVS